MAAKSKAGPTFKINTAWFRDRLIAKQISQRKLAKIVGMDAGAMSLTLRGGRKLQLTEAEAIAGELGVPVMEVLEAAGVNTSTGAHESALVVGQVGADGSVQVIRGGRVPTPAGMPQGTQVVRYQCDGARDGWMAFYVPSDGVSSDAVGKLAIVKLGGKDGTWLRVLKRGYGKGGWNLLGMFGETAIAGAQVVSASPVLWVKMG